MSPGKEAFALADSYKTQDPKWANWNELGKTETWDKADAFHIKETLALDYVNKDLIKSKKFKVVYDGVNGAGSVIGPKLLRELGCDVVELYCHPDGRFPRAEPVPEALEDLGKAVQEHKADIGFASDPDADRLALVDENGKPLGEEYTLVLAVDLITKHKPGAVTLNLSTSRMNEDLAQARGLKLEHAKVGEINVTSRVCLRTNLSLVEKAMAALFCPICTMAAMVY